MNNSICSYQIFGKHLVEPVLRFLYKYRENIVEGNPKYYVIDNEDDNNRIFQTMAGPSEFKYRVRDDIIIDIIIKEDGPALAIQHRLKLPIRITISSKSQDDMTAFLEKIEDDRNQSFRSEKKKTNVMVCDKYGEWYVYSRIPRRTIDSIYINANIKKQLLDDIQNFKRGEADYERFGIPYKKTYLLTGVPGSGKTSLIKAICNEIDYNLNMLSISKEFDNNTLMSSIRNIRDNSILLLEDIDALFEKRTSTRDNPGITFSNIINIMDGVLYRHGIIIFITTNHPEKLDPAMLRIGRVDMIFQINYPGKPEIKQLFTDLMVGHGTPDQIQTEFDFFWDAIRTKKITMSAIVNFLFRYRMAYRENLKELLDTNNFIQSVMSEDKTDLLYN